MSERQRAARPHDAPAAPATGIPLEHLDFRVAVTGTWAEVELEQRFGNRLDRPLEAVYVFPLQEESIVRGAKVQIGDRTVTSELRERKRAQEEYAQARDAGHDAAMVEQERPNVFTMSVARIDPGDQVHVTVPYAHRVPWQGSGGRLTIPLVVAPQFIPGVAVNAKGDTEEVPDASRITPPVAAAVPYRASVRARLTPGFPCRVACPSHPDRVAPFTMVEGETREVVLEDIAPDGDVVFTYETTAEIPVVTAMRSSFTYRGEREEYLVVQVFPGVMRMSDRPLDAVVVLDDSGSMRGEKVAGLRRVVAKVFQRAIRFGRPLRVAVEKFGDQPDVLVPLSEITEAHTRTLDGVVADSGGTNFGPAVSVAMGLLRKSPKDHDRCIVVVTDGDTGSTQYTKIPGVRVHMIGIDSAVNAEVVRMIAEETGGGTYAVLPGEDEDAAANEIVGLMSGPVLQGVTLEGLPDGAEIIGATDCYQLRPTTFAVRLPRSVDEITVVGRGEDGKTHRFIAKVTDADTPIGAQLWARSKLRQLQMQRRETRRSGQGPKDDAFTAISLRYGILGPTTAFIAVSERAVPGKDTPERVDVPVMVPRGWEFDAASGPLSAFAVGAPAGAIPVMAVMAAAGAPAPSAIRRMTGATMRMRGTGGPPSASSLTGGFSAPARGGASPTKGVVRRTLDALAGGVSRLTGGDPSTNGFAGDDFDVPPPPPIPQGPKASEVISLAEALLARLVAGEDHAKLRTEWKALVAAREEAQYYHWSEDDRCHLFELLSMISQHAGFEIEISDDFRTMPSDLTSTAYERWERAMILPTRKPKSATQPTR